MYNLSINSLLYTKHYIAIDLYLLWNGIGRSVISMEWNSMFVFVLLIAWILIIGNVNMILSYRPVVSSQDAGIYSDYQKYKISNTNL